MSQFLIAFAWVAGVFWYSVSELDESISYLEKKMGCENVLTVFAIARISNQSGMNIWKPHIFLAFSNDFLAWPTISQKVRIHYGEGVRKNWPNLATPANIR